MKHGSLIGRLFPHRAWPYPRGEREIRRVIIVTLCLVLVTLACLIVGLEYQDEKTLQASDLHFAAKDVTSYSSEAYLVATSSQAKPLVGPYRQVYVKQLGDEITKVQTKLATHEVSPTVHQKAVKLAAICDRLNDIVSAFSRNPTDQTFAAHAAELHRLANQAQAIEDSL